MESYQASDLTIYRFRQLECFDGLIHAVSGRSGGVSTGDYESLNLGLHTADEPAHVIENRRRFCRAAGIDAERIIAGAQTHGAGVAIVSESDIGRGAFDYAGSISETDALVCQTPGVPIMALSADCPLVIMYDPEAKVAAVMHSSWRSTALGIAAATLEAMQKLGARPESVTAAIAPCAGVCCYEVKQDFVHSVSRLLPGAPAFIRSCEGRMFFNLEQAVAAQLRRGGVLESNIEVAGICTICDGRFYSHRASGGKTGRFAALVAIC